MNRLTAAPFKPTARLKNRPTARLTNRPTAALTKPIARPANRQSIVTGIRVSTQHLFGPTHQYRHVAFLSRTNPLNYLIILQTNKAFNAIKLTI